MYLMSKGRYGWEGFKERRRYHVDKQEQIGIISKERPTF